MPATAAPRLRIIFAGTPEFALPALEALQRTGLPPVAVLTQPDRRAGRGRRMQTNPAKAFALRHDIPVLQPKRLGTDEVQAELRSFSPDLMIVAAYGLILPQAVLDLPRHGCWNIHASLLPRWRGAAPIQRAIEAGDTETGVCIMQMEAGLDTGPVFTCRTTPIEPHDTGGSLHDRLADLGARAMLECIDKLLDGSLPPPLDQDEDGVTYARKLDKSEARIDWTRSATELERQIRAYVPWPVAWCELGGERLRIWRAEVGDDGRSETETPGHILSADEAGIEVATGQGVLRLLEVQRSGGRRMPVADFLRARSLQPDP